MISIDRVEKLLPLHPAYPYHFPTIDFKFDNRGNGTAFLWQFVVNVLYSKIDLTPVLDFFSDIEGNVLQIAAINNGWGAAYDCHIQISESSLDKLFTGTARTYRGTLQSGENTQILSLTKNLVEQKQFKTMSRALNHVTLRERLHGIKPVYGIKIGTISVKWKCKDEENTEFTDEQQTPEHSDDFILSKDGFLRVPNPGSGGGIGSEVTYSVVIDPLKGATKQPYSISRQIPPGGVERFHIMIGASMSCRLCIQLQFFAGRTETFESEIFDIEIWNPRNSIWHYLYKDGTELRRDLEEKKRLIEEYKISDDWIKNEISQLQQKFSNYPFIK